MFFIWILFVVESTHFIVKHCWLTKSWGEYSQLANVTPTIQNQSNLAIASIYYIIYSIIYLFFAAYWLIYSLVMTNWLLLGCFAILALLSYIRSRISKTKYEKIWTVIDFIITIPLLLFALTI